MSRVVKSTTVDADPERVIEYIAEVDNHPAFIDSLQSVENLKGDPRKAGTTWDWTYVMGGVEFTGQAETVAYVPGRKYSYRTTSGIKSTFTYSAEKAGKGSKITVDVEYEVPKSLLAKMQTQAVEKMNDAEGTRAVENLKEILAQ